MNTVKVRGLTIGAGAPKIIVPIVGRTYEEIVSQAERFQDLPIDIVEWRADFFDEVFDIERTLYTLSALYAVLDAAPILFSIRTKREGGEKEIGMDAYTALNTAAAESGKADLIDVEIFSGDDIVRENIARIHAAGALVIGSSHDFHATPDKDEIVSRLRKMQDMGADIPKIAVMPTCIADVLTLLAATNEMHEKYADRPIITVSMEAAGLITRLSCEVFGSAATFGAVGRGSAPGQIPLEQLANALGILHGAM